MENTYDVKRRDLKEKEMKKKLSLVLFGVLAILILGGCAANEVDQDVVTPKDVSIERDDLAEKEDEIEKLQEELEAQTIRADHAESLNKQYSEFMENAMTYLNEEEMTKLGKAQFEYTLFINEVLVPKDGRVEVAEGPVEIMLRSETVSWINYPQEIYTLGQLSGEYSIDHLDFLGRKEDDLTVLDGTVVQTFVYIFGEEEPIESMDFRVSEELRERLGVETTEIKIDTKK